MKNEHLMSYYYGKTTRVAQGLGLALLLTLLLLLAACAGSTDSSQAPAGAPVNSDLTLSQAQQQAGYHLLSIPSSLTTYTLKRVNVFGTTDNAAYSLFYSEGKNAITIIERQTQPIPPNSSATKVSLRGTTGTLSTTKGLTTLSWTEKSVYITMSGVLSSNQMIALAKSLV